MSLWYESSQAKNLLWSKNGSQANRWNRVQNNIISGVEFKVYFEGVVGNGFRGDIAIDDIELTQSQCKFDGICDFEEGLCNFKNSNTDNYFNWTLGNNFTVPTGLGPSIDHVCFINQIKNN